LATWHHHAPSINPRDMTDGVGNEESTLALGNIANSI